MPTMIFSLLKNKYIIFGLIVAAIVSYYTIQGMSYRSDILSEQEKYSKLNKKYIAVKAERDELNVDLNKSITASNNNNKQCLLYKQSVQKFKKLYKAQNSNKDIQIKQLIATIQKLRKIPKPQITKDRIIVKDCVIYKGVPDESLNELSNIGH